MSHRIQQLVHSKADNKLTPSNENVVQGSAFVKFTANGGAETVLASELGVDQILSGVGGSTANFYLQGASDAEMGLDVNTATGNGVSISFIGRRSNLVNS